MGKFALFAAVVAVFIVIVIDAWLCIRTMTPVAGSTFNPLIITIARGAAPISQSYDYLLVTH